MSKLPTFIDCLYMAISEPCFIREYDRLTGSHLAALAKRPPIEILIDEATKHADNEMAKFCAFVYEFVWMTYPGPRAEVSVI